MKDIRKFLESIPKEEIERKNAEQLAENKEMFEDFKRAYEKKCCSLCGNKLNTFIEDEPCFHWFTLPKGIKKKHFKSYLSEPVGYFKLESYFRWMATLIHPLKNINDLSEEMSESKLREITIKYQNIEWSLNYGKNDLNGHKGTNSDYPHYHLQVLENNKPFIRFNDFHIPFSKEDLLNIRIQNEASDLVEFGNSQGEGMSFIEDIENLKELDKHMTVTDDIENGTFNSSTMITMPEGKTMSGDTIQKIIKESKKTKIPIRKLIQKYYPEARTATEINPGDGVPEMKKRTKRKK